MRGVGGYVGAEVRPRMTAYAEAWMPVSPLTLVDAAGGNLGSGAGEITVPEALTNAALFIVVGGRPFTDWPPPDVEWHVNGNHHSATLIDHVAGGTGDDGTALYVVLDPEPGMGTFGTHLNPQWCGAWLYSGVYQADPIVESAFAAATGAASSVAISGANGDDCINAVMVYDGDFTDDVPGVPVGTGGMNEDWSGVHQLGTPGFVDMLTGGGHGVASASWSFAASSPSAHPWTAFVARVRAA
jgi:hypothetical protein